MERHNSENGKLGIDYDHKAPESNGVFGNKKNRPPETAHHDKADPNGTQSKPAKPYREIYRPPSLRSKAARNSNVHNNNNNNTSTTNQRGNAMHNHKSNSNSGSHTTNNVQNDIFASQNPYAGRRSFSHENGNLRPQPQFNVNAKEFQLSHRQVVQAQHIQQPLLIDQNVYGNNNAGIYSIQQCKSLGSNLHILLQQQQNGSYTPFGINGFDMLYQNHVILPAQQRPQAAGFNRLAPSKSIGSIPEAMNKPKVRFEMDMDDNLNEAALNMIRNTENRFANLDISSHYHQDLRPAIKQPLQKSKTGFMLNLQSPNHHLSPVLQNFSRQESPRRQGTSVKRSRSFGSSGTGKRDEKQPVPVLPSYSDFQISRWPKVVQAIIIAAVTAVERVPARQQIEMVTLVFEAMLGSSLGSSMSEAECTATDHYCDGGNDDPTSPLAKAEGIITEDLSTPAVHIFLYFIQKEKDRTLMESLINTCFATYQRLFTKSTNESLLAMQSMVFLRFLSTLHTQVKLSRRQSQGPRKVDDICSSILAILCDSCLAMLRSQLSGDPESMGCLFTVLTSHGKEIEATSPQKMKMLLAAVRDVLLGLGPYAKGSLCPTVQKTLMQLVELHAASWSLPASAVRYYYSNTSPHSKNGIAN